jgi:GTP1/Obg family GTP-binding protein
MAWAVGVFIAYLAHDKDPDFMDATHQYNRAHRRYRRLRRPFVNRVRQIKAKLTKDIERLESAARTQAADVAAERALLEQIDKHEDALLDALTAVVRANAQHYHASLAQLAASQRGALTIERVGANPGQISVGEFRNQTVAVTPAMLRALA